MIGAVLGLFSRSWGWAKTHKNIAIPIAAGLGCGCAAWFLKPAPPQPKVEAHVADTAAQVGKTASDTHKEEAAVRIVKRKFTCPSVPGAPQALKEETITDRGPVLTDKRKAEEHANTQEHRLDLTITPQARPGWEFQAGLEDVFHAKTLRLAARRRLLGPFWAELAVVPAQKAVGAAVAVEW